MYTSECDSLLVLNNIILVASYKWSIIILWHLIYCRNVQDIYFLSLYYITEVTLLMHVNVISHFISLEHEKALNFHYLSFIRKVSVSYIELMYHYYCIARQILLVEYRLNQSLPSCILNNHNSYLHFI